MHHSSPAEEHLRNLCEHVESVNIDEEVFQSPELVDVWKKSLIAFCGRDNGYSIMSLGMFVRVHVEHKQIYYYLTDGRFGFLDDKNKEENLLYSRVFGYVMVCHATDAEKAIFPKLPAGQTEGEYGLVAYWKQWVKDEAELENTPVLTHFPGIFYTHLIDPMHPQTMRVLSVKAGKVGTDTDAFVMRLCNQQYAVELNFSQGSINNLEAKWRDFAATQPQISR